MSLSDREIFEFDSFRLDPAERLLLCDNVPVPLEPKVFETLVVLVRHFGRLVTKEELMQAVWPDTFVEESNLVRNISLLRKALNRDDSGQRYIESVPKWGYRFVSEVRSVTGERAELVLETSKVSVVIEEELEIDGESAAQQGVATPRAAELAGDRDHSVAIERTSQSFGQLKRNRLAVVLTLVLLIAAVATAVYLLRGSQKIDSIAVLPFINVEADPGTEYLSDGITDSLINSLSQLPEIRVMSRNSVFRFKGNGADAQQAGNALGVRAVLTGKVVQRGNDLMISAELVDVRDNSHLWGERYERKLSDLLAVQKELTRGISQRLKLEFSDEAQQRMARRDPENAEAYELYLKGRYALNNLTRQQQSGLGYFQQAIEKDPHYSLAYAGMAEAYVLMADIGATFRLPPKEAFTLARAAALKAIDGDDARAEAYVSLGRIAFSYEWDWAGTEREFKRAIALKPDFVPAHHWYSHFLISQGRFDESLAESLRALALDPLDVAMNFHLGFHYWTAGQYDQASAQLEKTLTMNPSHFETHGILGLVYAQQKRYPEAIGQLQKTRELGGWDYRGMLGYVYAISGQREEAQKILAQLHEEARSKVVSPHNIARIYAGLGEKEQAFVWLEKAIAERDSNLTMPGLRVDPTFESLHEDSRFTGLLDRVTAIP
jgi:TolB-like protein/DNA-binding winged helix-turn-helix (wHTH) protein/tetratricopeptide (TPR) repeat protein